MYFVVSLWINDKRQNYGRFHITTYPPHHLNDEHTKVTEVFITGEEAKDDLTYVFTGTKTICV
jgi:hypothetical protein